MKSPCKPGIGKTYLTIGQDLFSINEYQISQYNRSLHQHRVEKMTSFAPAVAMVYTDLKGLQGLDDPVDYGSGVEYADGIINSIFSDSSVGLQIGLWLNGTYGCEQILAGKMDVQISKLSKYLQNNNASATFLRIGYEFDNPFFHYSDNPGAYVRAFQKIVRDLEEQLTPDALMRTQFVWHSWAAPRKGNLTLDDFWPGSEFVDWIGVSIFQQVFPWPSNWGNGFVDWGGDMSDVEEVLQFAQKKTKPTMIAESSPFGGINMNTADTTLYREHDPWERWYGKVLNLIVKYDIDMWSYINCDWDSQPMWRGVGFHDSRLSSNEIVMERWQEMIINGSYGQTLLMSGSLDDCGSVRKRLAEIDVTRTSIWMPSIFMLIALGIIFQACVHVRKRRNMLVSKGVYTTSEAAPLVFNRES